MEDNKRDNIELVGKVAKFPKNTKAVHALKFLENVKANPKKLWYIIIEDQDTDLKMVKYNRSQGVDLNEYTQKLKEYYIKYYENTPEISSQLEQMKVEGENEFSVIKNIPTITLENNQTLISKIASDLIKLLGE